MLEKALHQLRGQVRVRVTSAYPERVLNLCGARHIAFWEVQWVSPTEFTCRLGRQDWYRLRRAAKDLPCELKPEKKGGMSWNEATHQVTFTKTEQEPVEADAVIVDEMSMRPRLFSVIVRITSSCWRMI